MRVSGFIAAAFVAALAATQSNATVLNGVVSGDDVANVYLSTDPNTLGTLVGSNTSWFTGTSMTSGALTPGDTYYLQIVVTNAGDNVGGLLGQFTLSDSGFSFGNGTQSLLTNTTNWLADLAGSWAAPTDAAISQGANSDSTTVWYGVNNGPVPNIDLNADWLWASDGTVDGGVCGATAPCTVDFMTTITPAATSVP